MGLIQGRTDTEVLKFLLKQMHYTNDGSGSHYGYHLEFTVPARSKQDAIRKLMEAKGNEWNASWLPDAGPKPRKKRKKKVKL